MNKNYDLIVAGGGTSGVAAAVSASRNGCKVLLIEKNSFLGGTATGALVTPMMKNMTESGENLTDGLVLEVIDRLKKSGNCAEYKDGNPGWFNPEMLKCILDDFCEENSIDILFDTAVIGANVKNKKIKSVKCRNKSGISELKAEYFIDATGDADLAALSGVPFESDEHQTMSLRFILTNVDIDAFARWLTDIDPDSNITSVDYKNIDNILLTTAHTWDDCPACEKNEKNKKISECKWKLRPFFNDAVKQGILEKEDAAYFQVFSISGQKNAVALNCPRISSEKQLDPLDSEDISYAYKQGRKQIRRLAEFCKTYLIGFEDSYISQIAPQLGVRDSRRIKGKYQLTEEDIFNAKKFDNPVARSNYPVDIHAKEKGKNELKHLPPGQFYEIPLESLMPVNIENLLVVGRCISATFRAQASIRIQPNCWSMGEYAGKYIAAKIN